MDRSDPFFRAAVDPPTAPTQPTKHASGAAQEPDTPAVADGTPAPSIVPGREHAPEQEVGALTSAADGATSSDSTSDPSAVAQEPVTPSLAEVMVAAPLPFETEQAARQRDAVQLPATIEPASDFVSDHSAIGVAPSVGRDAGRQPLLGDWTAEQVKASCVRAAKVAGIVFCAWFTSAVFLIAVYRFVNPPFSSLMALQWLGGTSIEQRWVPLDRISPNLMRAVIASEDGRFCRHWGIDFAEIADAIKRSSGGVPRGASTITMQVAKNLFLWPAKSYVRKLIEVPLTYAIEIFWSKQRILEVYLNIAELGPGIFGAEAAARAHFDRSADRLSPRQAAQLAVSLPNPFTRDAGDPGPWAARRASVIQRRAARDPSMAGCVTGN